MDRIKESEEAQFSRLEEELKEDPKNVSSLIDKGVLFFEHFHLHDEAIDCFTRAIKYDPKNVEAFFWLAVCYFFDFLEYAEAKEALRKALELDPDRADCLSLMGTVIADEGKDIEKAIAFIRKAIEKAPTWPSHYHELARLLLEQGKIEEAEKVLKEGLKYKSQLAEFANSKERYYERVITGRASSCGQEGWDYLMNEIEEAKQKRIKL